MTGTSWYTEKRVGEPEKPVVQSEPMPDVRVKNVQEVETMYVYTITLFWRNGGEESYTSYDHVSLDAANESRVNIATIIENGMKTGKPFRMGTLGFRGDEIRKFFISPAQLKLKKKDYYAERD